MTPTPGTRGNKISNSQQGSGTDTASILSFFKPVVRSPSRPSTPSSAASQLPAISSSPSLPSPSPSPLPSASPSALPSTPVRNPKTEIGASDDEGSDGGHSDESLEDLACLLGYAKNPGPVHQKSPCHSFATPKAKRTAIEFHSSPLAIISKHKFDLKALAQDARYDEATAESSLRMQQAASAAKQRKNDGLSSSSATGNTIAGIVREKGGQEQDAQKVLRAVQRSEPSQSQHRYLFFEQTYRPPPLPKAPTLPRDSPWNLLTRGSATTREQHLTSGVPQTILRKVGGLPDSVFEWMLDSLCLEPFIVTRQEYCNMIATCPEQIDRLLTAERIRQLFVLLGARDLDLSNPELGVTKMDHEPYQHRDWSCLRSFIFLLGLVADQLSVPTAMYAAQTLIHLALDRFLICNIDMLSVFEHAMQKLTSAIPSPSWDTFCFETSALLSGIKTSNITVTALLCIPIGSKRTHDVRRRIAVSALFHDDALARCNSEDTVTLRAIIDRLDSDIFAIRPNTDFAELRANILLLDIAVDDGSVIHFDDRDDETRFNDEVDELAGRLREIWRRTNDAGMRLARTEAKSVVEWVQQRLLHSVRTRRKARKSIFDAPGHQQEDPFLPRQRDYMHKFLQRKPKSPEAAATVTVSNAGSIDEHEVLRQS
ncbi:hypothetical protein E4U42_006453 [Claviceps africana]|uniref:Uncharacterized protein n=1 Tax=Claviceps africana TaxID=83212 RepID=A0A8K0NGS6_9HYPO|nr:hypothetical protein E4U42_006453 [Claviceps africana]